MVAFLAAGCGVEETVVARVGGIEVHDERIQLYLEGVTGIQWAEVDSRVASRLFDQFLEQEAAIQALGGRPEGAQDDPVARSILLRDFVKDFCGPPPTASPAEIDAAVEKRMAEVVPDRVYIRQLLLRDAAEAQEARIRFDQGEEFIDLSRELSRVPNAEDGGVIGWVTRGTQPDDVESQIFALEVGQVSEPVEGPAGYHLFQVLEIRDSGQVSEVVAASEARLDLESAGSREHLDRCVDQAVDRAGVVIFKENLWFDYQGRFAEG